MIHPDVGDEIPHQHVGGAKLLREQKEHRGRDGEAEIAQEDVLCVLGFVQRASGIEMVDAVAEAILLAPAPSFKLPLVEIVPRRVGEEVHGPAEKLLREQLPSRHNGSLLGQLDQLMGIRAHAASVLGSGLGHEHHVALHVCGGLVMLAVRDLPRKVGDQEGRVADPTHDVVEQAVVGEAAVAALVGEYPDARCLDALYHGI